MEVLRIRIIRGLRFARLCRFFGQLVILLYCISTVWRRLGAGFSFFSLFSLLLSSHLFSSPFTLPSKSPSKTHPITKVRYIRFFLAPTLDCQDRLYKTRSSSRYKETENPFPLFHIANEISLATW